MSTQIESERGGRAACVFKPRQYQIEMFEESLLRNLVIAMPTGSGKTLIAIMRARQALEQSSVNKLVWFCTPGVQLARQQFEKISMQLSMFRSILLSGADNCDLWHGRVWDEVLCGTQIVVSTFEILRQALGHAYVSLERMCLLIFDETHHAVGRHAASLIMKDYYQRTPNAMRPPFLGLTATPTTRIANLSELESNLSAVCRTPDSSRQNLEQHVHIPTFIRIPYSESIESTCQSETLGSLERVLTCLDVREDPWVIRMMSQPETSNSYRLSKALSSGKTNTRESLKTLYQRSSIVAKELGPWLAEVYIQQCINGFLTRSGDTMSSMNDFVDGELLYLRRKLEQVSLPALEDLTIPQQGRVSAKVEALVEFLQNEEPTQFRGLVFARTRAEVAMLTHLLTIHPKTSKFSTASFVGASNFPSRKHALAELLDVKLQQGAIENLGVGLTQIIVATEALEEGIDIVSLDAVICFDTPNNVRSFIQRRGRASRKANSRFVILSGDDEDSDTTTEWADLERSMTEIFQDKERDVEEIDGLEERDDRLIVHQDTARKLGLQTLLTVRNAFSVGHLSHFCSFLTRDPFVDPTPTYDYDIKGRYLRAKVRLPNVVEPHLRFFQGSTLWRSEQSARRDCAFEAYRAIYESDLLDEHLLPRQVLDETVQAALQNIEVRPNVASVAGQINMWYDVAKRSVSADNSCYVTKISLLHDTEDPLEICLYTFFKPQFEEFRLFWDTRTTFTFRCDTKSLEHAELPNDADRFTKLLLCTAFGTRLSSTADFLVKFAPFIAKEDGDSLLQHFTGATEAREWPLCNTDQLGLIRDMARDGLPFIYRNYQIRKREDLFTADNEGLPMLRTGNKADRSESLKDQILSHLKNRHLLEQDFFVVLDVTRFPKRRDYIHQDTVPLHKSANELLLLDCCHIDNLPFKYTRFALFIPAIMHKLHIGMVVDHLCSTLLLPLEHMDKTLIKSAILASSAREGSNYQRLEFLGDSILKLSTTVMLLAEHTAYSESILSRLKDHIVSNVVLAKAAIESGLDKFIVTEAFSGFRWVPPCRADYDENSSQATREMSTKILADVVEALIGAAFLHGSYPKAIACLKIFLPQQPWDTAESAFEILHRIYEERPQPQAVVKKAEQIVQYNFERKALIAESICHASHQESGSWAPYERLEFLGDAVLDNIVTVAAHNRDPPLSVKRLHLIRSALVNGDMLGYLCLQFGIEIIQTTAITRDRKNIYTEENPETLKLWQLLRYASPTIRVALKACVNRFNVLEGRIAEGLTDGDRHPWSLLAQLEPPKPLSDIVEAILGAIFIDSSGSMSQCEAFLDRIGLMKALHRILGSDSINLWHPKEELGQLSNQDDVRYEMSKHGEEGRKFLTCRVLVGDRELAFVQDGRSAMEIQTRAAEIAGDILRREKMDIDAGTDDGTNIDDCSEYAESHGGSQVSRGEDESMKHVSEGSAGSDDYMTADE